MNGNTSPTRAALDAAAGIVFSAACVYLILYAREIFTGAHYIDWSLLRALCLIGLLTLGVSFYENRVAG
ncbi:hypothetical protein [Neolewinella litorea]|uniref:Uncharacterized protein n=1 Tax=Neolewinella litorea TaxID=2562452 RepID=A0A4S4NJH6_9BACT|nr:hypothetical protein [Neolewinella litorea]THH39919.1 hypothetical protein E4021_09930 [Neolewinella litorea]